MVLSLLLLLSPNLRACGQTWRSFMANRDILRVRGQWREPTVTSKKCLWAGWQITSLVLYRLDNGCQVRSVCKNSSHHSGINRSPYAAMFGTSARTCWTNVNIATVWSYLPTGDWLETLPTEETYLVTEEEAAPSIGETPPVTEETSPSI